MSLNNLITLVQSRKYSFLEVIEALKKFPQKELQQLTIESLPDILIKLRNGNDEEKSDVYELGCHLILNLPVKDQIKHLDLFIKEVEERSSASHFLQELSLKAMFELKRKEFAQYFDFIKDCVNSGSCETRERAFALKLEIIKDFDSEELAKYLNFLLRCQVSEYRSTRELAKKLAEKIEVAHLKNYSALLIEKRNSYGQDQKVANLAKRLLKKSQFTETKAIEIIEALCE